MILVDTSAWVEFDHATGSRADEHLAELIGAGAALAATEPVLMEVLAGARDDMAAGRLRRMLTSFGWIPADPVADFEGAASVYRKCRSAGITPSGLIDCMIASIAIRSGSRLLTADSDFTRIAEVLPLRLE